MSEINNNESKDEDEGCSARCGNRIRSFLRFLYNPVTKEIIGRKALSWAQILSYYIVFYALLAGYFAICMAVFLATISPLQPTKQSSFSLLKNSPALQFVPQVPEATLINFNAADPTTYNNTDNHNYIALMSAEILKYNNADQSQLKNCTPLSGPTETKACYFDPSLLSPCIDNRFGYNLGQPCIMLKINKIYGWNPNGTTFTEGTVKCDGSKDDSTACQFSRISAKLKTVVRNNYVAVSCEGQAPEDTDNLLSVDFHPKDGFPAHFFPFLNQPNFLAPPLMARFKVRPGRAVMVWCRFWVNGVVHDLIDMQASTHFEMLVDVPAGYLANLTVTSVTSDLVTSVASSAVAMDATTGAMYATTGVMYATTAAMRATTVARSSAVATSAANTAVSSNGASSNGASSNGGSSDGAQTDFKNYTVANSAVTRSGL